MTNYIIDEKIGPVDGIKKLLTDLMEKGLVDGVMVPAATPWSSLPMPHLFTKPEEMTLMSPLAPAAPFNAARQAAQVLSEDTGKKMALVLKPCEARALVELAKLKQCETGDNCIIISMECLGRVENKLFLENLKRDSGYAETFYRDPALRKQITQSCSHCTGFIPESADLTLLTLGSDFDRTLVRADSVKGEALMEPLSLEETDDDAIDGSAVLSLQQERESLKAENLTSIKETAGSVEGLQQFLAGCLNCFNCRKACPVCYCRDCVFKTDVFDVKPDLLFKRAEKRGGIKLPQDTTMFHMTRMLHIGHACVECGHCTSACPMDIPVADIFRLSAGTIQELYGYKPGRDLLEKIPMLSFGEDN